MLCSVYGARDSEKEQKQHWWKMAMPSITQTKRNDKVNKTMGIAVGLDK